jgi:hypothetical protein
MRPWRAASAERCVGKGIGSEGAEIHWRDVAIKRLP